MKQNYNIKENPPKLSRESIERHMDFDALLNRFEQSKEALPKNGASSGTNLWVKYGLGAALAVAASFLLIFMIRGLLGDGSNDFLLQGPYPNLQKEFMSFVLDADKGDTLHYNTGSTIVVPAAAFVDKKGKPVHGKVDIQYREFDDPIELFLSGVPQRLKKDEVLQSAGTLHIQGFQDGEEVFINKEKPLQVALRATIVEGVSTKDLKIYSFDAKKDAWQYQSASNIEFLTKKDNSLEVRNDSAKNIPKTNDLKLDDAALLALINKKYPKPHAPLKPSQIQANMQAFDVDTKTNEFPELKQYKEIIWVANQKDLKDEWFEVEWRDVKVTRKGEMQYQITLSNEKRSVSVDAFPLVPYSQKTLENYQKQLIIYELALAERDQKINAEFGNWQKERPADIVINRGYGPNSDSLHSASNSEPSLVSIVNHFSLAHFGLWNCANSVALDKSTAIVPSFVDAAGHKVMVKDVFVSNPTQQLYYSAKANERIPFNPQSEQDLWAMDDKQQLWVLDTQKESPNIILKPAPIIRSEIDVRRAITL